MINTSESFNFTDSESGDNNVKQESMMDKLSGAVGNLLKPITSKLVDSNSDSDFANNHAIANQLNIDSEINPEIVPLADALDNAPVAPGAPVASGAPVVSSSGSQNGGFDIDDANSKYWEMKYYKYKSKYFKEKERQNTL